MFAAVVAAAFQVHVHTAADAGFRANAYLVELDAGVVAVDAPFTVSESKALRAELDALKKPLLAVLVTHAHPDHVNGITQLVAGLGDVPVIATAAVDRALREIDGRKRAYWTPIYKDEYPALTTFPNRLVPSGDTVELGGLGFKALDLGAGESVNETVWVLDSSTAFVGDLVMNRVHPWLAEGRSAQWIAALRKAGKLLRGVKNVYPGHGQQGTLESLEWQRRYLEAFRANVKSLAKGSATLDDASKKELATRMEKELPGAPLAMLVGLSADPVAAELKAEK